MKGETRDVFWLLLIVVRRVVRDILVEERGFDELINSGAAFRKPASVDGFPEVNLALADEEDTGAIGVFFSRGRDDTMAVDNADKVRDVELASGK